MVNVKSDRMLNHECAVFKENSAMLISTLLMETKAKNSGGCTATKKQQNQKMCHVPLSISYNWTTSHAVYRLIHCLWRHCTPLLKGSCQAHSDLLHPRGFLWGSGLLLHSKCTHLQEMFLNNATSMIWSIVIHED